MSRSVLIVRLCAAVAVFAIAVVLVGHHLGLPVPGCGEVCSRVQSLWFSGFFVVAMVGSSAGCVVTLIRQDEAGYRRVAWLQGAAAIVAAGIAIEGKLFCPLCVVTQGLWAVMALEATPLRWVRIAAAPCSILAAFAVMDAIDFSRPIAEPVGLVMRSYEARVKGSPAAVVIFTDPLCPFCRSDEREFAMGRVPVPVLYRWKLLPQHGSAAVTLAALLESAKRRSYRGGCALQEFIYCGSPVPSQREIVAEGVKLGFSSDQIGGWMQAPEAASLEAIAEDGQLASKVGVPQVPFVCVVDTAFEYHGGPQIRPLRAGELGPMSEVTGGDWSALRSFLEPGSREENEKTDGLGEHPWSACCRRCREARAHAASGVALTEAQLRSIQGGMTP